MSLSRDVEGDETQLRTILVNPCGLRVLNLICKQG